MKVVSIQVGIPKIITNDSTEVTTAIFKSPVNGPVMLGTLNLEGDCQADLSVHGGHDKALYAYSLDAYPIWKSHRPHDTFDFGAFGENLSMDHLPEDQIYIGDTYELGQAIVQVTQPRFPCYKLGLKFNNPSILKQFMKLNRPGVYFRVLKEGLIDTNQDLRLIERDSILLSVLELFNLGREFKPDPQRAREILRIKSLTAHWKEEFESRVAAAATGTVR